MPKVILRLSELTDVPCIMDTWMRSFQKHAASWLGWVTPHTFVALYRPVVARLLADGRVRVLCDEQDESAIVGWACVEGRKLHYVWVRDGWRQEGYARRLVEDITTKRIQVTHNTDLGAKTRWQERCARWRYAPQLLEESCSDFLR